MVDLFNPQVTFPPSPARMESTTCIAFLPRCRSGPNYGKPTFSYRMSIKIARSSPELLEALALKGVKPRL
jgi:hypothetical protein